MCFNKIVARLNNVSDLGNGRFLGYCKTHKDYYEDFKHTNGEIRCPDCDADWLKERRFQ